MGGNEKVISQKPSGKFQQPKPKKCGGGRMKREKWDKDREWIHDTLSAEYSFLYLPDYQVTLTIILTKYIL